MKKELLILGLAAIYLTPSSLLAQERDEHGYKVPDEINKTKYFNIYEASKKISDRQRARANSAKAKAQGIDSRISTIEATISNNEESLRSNRSEIQRMRIENPELEVTNTRLSQEAEVLRDDIRLNGQTRGRLQTDRDSVQADQDQERGTYTDVTRSLQVNQTDIDNNNNSISSGEGRQASLNSQNASLDQRNSELDAQRATEGQRLNDLTSERSQRSDRMRILAPEMERLRNEVLTWAGMAADKEEKVRKVQEFVDFTRDQLLDLDARVEIQYGKRDNLEGKLKDLRKVKRALDTRLAELEKTKKDEKKRSGVVAKEITRLNELNPKTQIAIGKLEAEIKALQDNKIKPLQAQNKTSQGTIKTTRKQLNETVKNAVNDPEVKKLISGKEAELKVFTDKIAKKKSSIANEIIQIEQME